MVGHIIEWSVRHRWVVFVATAMFAAWAVVALRQICLLYTSDAADE